MTKRNRSPRLVTTFPERMTTAWAPNKPRSAGRARLIAVLARRLVRCVYGPVVVHDPLAPRTPSSRSLRRVQVAGPICSHGVAPGLPVGGDRGRQPGAVKRLGPDQRGQQLGRAGGSKVSVLFGKPDEVAQPVVDRGGPFDTCLSPVAAHRDHDLPGVFRSRMSHPIYIIRSRTRGVGGTGRAGLPDGSREIGEGSVRS